MRSVRQLGLAVVLFVLFAVCSTSCKSGIIPTSPTIPVEPPLPVGSELPDYVLQGWGAAKGRLFEKGMTCVAGREPDVVNWIFEPGSFDCGGVEANGCFWVTNFQPYIALNEMYLNLSPHDARVTLVAHEVSHYLLWACADPNWACYLYEESNYNHPGDSCK